MRAKNGSVSLQLSNFILKKVLVLTNKRRQILPIPPAQFSISFNDLRKTSFYRVHINP